MIPSLVEDILFHKKFSIKGGDFAKAGEASVEVKNILKEVGFDPEVIRRVAIASYEAEMNVVMYGGGGEMDLTVEPDEMREMGFGAGMGLPNIKKNSDELNIMTEVNRGTRLEMVIKSHRSGSSNG